LVVKRREFVERIAERRRSHRIDAIHIPWACDPCPSAQKVELVRDLGRCKKLSPKITLTPRQKEPPPREERRGINI
jgi:hypothetical protein